MSESSVETAWLVRVTLVAGSRRADLALPVNLPVAELIPALAQSSGLLDAQSSYAGYHLADRDGHRMSGEATLLSADVDEGDVLTLSAGVDDPEPRVYDDVVEAMGDVVEEQTRPWDPATSRRTALSAAGLLLVVGGTALALQRPSLLAAVSAAVAAVLLLAAAIVLEVARHEDRAATMLALAAAGFAFVAGFAAVDASPLLGYPVAAGAAGALFVGLVAVLTLRAHRGTLMTAVVVPVVVAACSGLIGYQDIEGVDRGHSYVVVLAVAVLVGSIWPWIALGGTRTKVDEAYSEADLLKDPAPIDAASVRADVAIGHELLLGITLSMAVLTILVAPLAVRLGVAGTLLAICCCAVQMLRTRQYRDGVEVGTGLVGGLLGLVSVSAGVLVLHESWRPYLALTLAVVATVLLVVTLVPQTPSVRRGRLGDVAELVALVAIAPLLVVAVGLVAAVT